MTDFLLILLLLGLSGFFSGCETAYFSLSRLRLKELEEEGSTTGERINRLLAHPQKLLVTILLGNTLANTALASLAAIASHRMASDLGLSHTWTLVIDVVLVSFVILVVSEVTPKVFAIHNAESWARMSSLPLSLLQVLLAPVVWPAARLTESIKRQLRGDEAIHLSGEELRTLVEVGGESGTLEEDEKQLISSIFEFGETTVREVMVPRIDMICLEDTASLDDAVALIREMGHSRIPMYHERVDNIVGIIYAKDLIPYLHSPERSQSLDHLARLPYFVPEGKKIDELLREFQTGRMHLAIVVDEYGGTAGLISLEDILEEIVGEIQDEFDSELPLFRKSGEASWLMDSRIAVEDANKALGEELLPTDEDYESLGGFVYKLAGEVPAIKSSYTHLGWRFTVMTMKRHRIGLVRVDRLEDGRFDEVRGDSL